MKAAILVGKGDWCGLVHGKLVDSYNHYDKVRAVLKMFEDGKITADQGMAIFTKHINLPPPAVDKPMATWRFVAMHVLPEVSGSAGNVNIPLELNDEVLNDSKLTMKAGGREVMHSPPTVWTNRFIEPYRGLMFDDDNKAVLFGNVLGGKPWTSQDGEEVFRDALRF